MGKYATGGDLEPGIVWLLFKNIFLAPLRSSFSDAVHLHGMAGHFNRLSFGEVLAIRRVFITTVRRRDLHLWHLVF